MEANGLPSRTSILTAAARALGSREPDASVRNPDWVADRLIGPAELALIADHPDQHGARPGFPGRHERSRRLRLRLADAGADAVHRRTDGARRPRRGDAAGDPGRRIRYAGPPLRRTVEGRRGHRDRLRRHPGVQEAARRSGLGRRARQPGLRPDRFRAGKPRRGAAPRRFPAAAARPITSARASACTSRKKG